jgi:regulatory protein YycH of two-component signal transduction system YycFG
MELKLFYNISGAWPQVSCERIDTITSVILPNTTVLKGIAYSINYNDTTIESTKQIPACSLTGIESLDNSSFFKLYPNPFSTQINFQFTDNLPAKIILYDFLGQQILQKTFTNSTTINTEQLANGIYFYELLNDKRIVKTGKVVKQ